MVQIETGRLILRDWRESDLEPWAAMNADPEVRRYLGPPLTRAQAAAGIRRYQEGLDRGGFGFWAIEVRATGEFVGFAGLDLVEDGMPFTGVEAGWRLARSAWGWGYATEAARAVFEYGFETLRLGEILGVTALANHRSRAVMERLGMTHDPADDFDDPDLVDGPLRRQVRYRKRRSVPH